MSPQSPATPRLSVIFPTLNRGEAVGRCLARLAQQSLDPADFEVIVVHDGPDPQGESALANADTRLRTISIRAPRLGIAHAKNLAIDAARAPLILSINDDILPQPDFLMSHLRAHEELQARGERPAMVLGYSPFATPPASQETLFDRLLRETSMIFFYDRMADATGQALAPRDHDWGYRHAWNLNLSVRRADLLAIGGFCPAIANCCYEDIDLAYRASRQLGARVLFRPEARADHDHRYTPEAYFGREWRLGYSAYGLAHAAPQTAREVLGRDVTSPAELAYARAFVEREGASEAAWLAGFAPIATTLASGVSEAAWPALRSALLAGQVMLKRLAFRRGLLAAAEETQRREDRPHGLFHPRDGLATSWRWAAADAA